jgi:hypothetical protein
MIAAIALSLVITQSLSAAGKNPVEVRGGSGWKV